MIERAQKIAGKKGHAYENPEEMYKDEDLDAVCIATPHFLHKPMIKQALEEGKHVFCEKPITISVEDAREINQLDKKFNNLKIGIDYQYRYDPNCNTLATGVQIVVFIFQEILSILKRDYGVLKWIKRVEGP
jgi:predicted dehydrogenase